MTDSPTTVGAWSAGAEQAGAEGAEAWSAGAEDTGTVVAGKVMIAEVTERPLDAGAHQAAVQHARAGASVTFTGMVRNHDHGRAVAELEYEAHPTASRVLRSVAEQIAADPEILAVAVSHRVGHLNIGEAALVASVATAHRDQAFTACARLVDEVKHQLPVWKRQIFTDGTDEWVNCP